MLTRLFTVVVFLIIALPLYAAERDLTSDLSVIFNERFGTHGAQEPGALVAVMRRDKLLLQEAIGLAELETQKPLTANTQMRIASLSKQFVAVAVLQEMERGTLKLNDPISKFLPELADAASGVTVQQLLHHTSGLPHHSLLFMNEGLVPYNPGPPAGFLFAPAGSRVGDFMPTNEDVVRLLAEHPNPRFAPGTGWEYSNAGYILLVQILEAINNKPFRDLASERLFHPLGMYGTGVLDETRPGLDNMAHSYRVTKGGFEERDYSPFNLLHGDGGIFSTLNDLIRWRRAFKPGVLLRAESLALISANGRLADDVPISGTPRGNGYSMGWFTDTLAADQINAPILLHGGGWLNFRHAIYFAPDQDLWVVVLTNRSDTRPYETAEALMKVALEQSTAE